MMDVKSLSFVYCCVSMVFACTSRVSVSGIDPNNVHRSISDLNHQSPPPIQQPNNTQQPNQTHDHNQSQQPNQTHDHNQSQQPNKTYTSNFMIHPEKIGFYMIPDLSPPYTNASGNLGVCPWGTLLASLTKLHQLLPNTLLRWDNETGHQPLNITQTFVACASVAGINIMLTASAIDGYNNYWALGNNTPKTTMIDIANGPYINTIAQLYQNSTNIKFVETLCEPDGLGWFYSDSGNVADFDYYMKKLIAAMGLHSNAIVGPSAAFRTSNIFNDFLNNYASITHNLSYHTYEGWRGLMDYTGRAVYVTEYGFNNAMDPGFILNDLLYAEINNKLSNSIQMLHYVQLISGSQPGFNSNTEEFGHFGLADWLRALALYQAVGMISTNAYIDKTQPYFVVSDSTQGDIAILVWNNSVLSMRNKTIIVPYSSLQTGSNLYALTLLPGSANIATCQPLGSQSWANVQITTTGFQANIQNIPPHAAMMISTNNCNYLAN